MAKPKNPNITEIEHRGDKTPPKGFHKTCNNCNYRHKTLKNRTKESKMVVKECPAETRYELRARRIARDKTDSEFETTEGRRNQIEKILKLKEYARPYLQGQRKDIRQGVFSFFNAIGIEHQYRQEAKRYLREKPSINELIMTMNPCENWEYRGHPVPKEFKMSPGVPTSANIQFKTGVKDYLCSNCHRTFNEEETTVDNRCPKCDNETLTKVRPSKTRTVEAK